MIVEPMANRLSLVPANLRSLTGREPLAGEVEAFARYVEAMGA